jgi:pilus assembly protein TadC
VLRRYAQRRRRSVEAELPVLVDLLSLLQGSGQGIRTRACS